MSSPRKNTYSTERFQQLITRCQYFPAPRATAAPAIHDTGDPRKTWENALQQMERQGVYRIRMGSAPDFVLTHHGRLRWERQEFPQLDDRMDITALSAHHTWQALCAHDPASPSTAVVAAAALSRLYFEADRKVLPPFSLGYLNCGDYAIDGSGRYYRMSPWERMFGAPNRMARPMSAETVGTIEKLQQQFTPGGHRLWRVLGEIANHLNDQAAHLVSDFALAALPVGRPAPPGDRLPSYSVARAWQSILGRLNWSHCCALPEAFALLCDEAAERCARDPESLLPRVEIKLFGGMYPWLPDQIPRFYDLAVVVPEPGEFLEERVMVDIDKIVADLAKRSNVVLTDPPGNLGQQIPEPAPAAAPTGPVAAERLVTEKIPRRTALFVNPLNPVGRLAVGCRAERITAMEVWHYCRPGEDNQQTKSQ
jgi:hypothetical protein